MTDRPRRVQDVWVKPEGDHVVIHLRQTGPTLRLNATAFAIWELCDGLTSTGEMAAAVADLTGLGEDEARQQVESAVADLREAGLLV